MYWLGEEVLDMGPEWQLDLESRSPSFHSITDTTLLNVDLIARLKNVALRHGPVRLCMHAGSHERTHVMVIAQPNGHYSPPKKHPKYGKWVQVLAGELRVATFNEVGGVLTNEALNPQESFGCYIARDVFHANFPQSDVVVFLESVAGPFNRGESNCNADWAPSAENPQMGLKFMREHLA